jgi:hypothetical protein
MVLTLANRPAPELSPRTVLPACIQARAPLSYEIRDADDRRVSPTLGGYQLRRGTTYYLRVQAQDRHTTGWELRLLAPRSVIEPPARDQVFDDGRVIGFNTVSHAAGEFWKRFQSDVTNLPVQLEFTDGRKPFRFAIPIVLLASRFRWVGSLLLTALASFLSSAVFSERLMTPSLSHVALFCGIWAFIVVLCVSWDHWRIYCQALRVMAGRRQPPMVDQRSTQAQNQVRFSKETAQ